jgi:precorrin-3B C17-methyltransferase
MGAMSGMLAVVGLGPGSTGQLTPDACVALEAADVVFGYGPYLERVPNRIGQRRQASDNREEIARAESALSEAAEGASVAVVSGGDPGVFAMAAAICEAIERGPAEWRELDVAIVPGITSMLAVAARVGAPLGHDFCALSLSDNLKPWPIVEHRLEAAASAGFAIALYNPISRSRPWQLDRAFEVLRTHLPLSTPVIFGRAVGRADERVQLANLATAHGSDADMSTCIIVGSADTRLIERPNRAALVYTPRSVGAAST